MNKYNIRVLKYKIFIKNENKKDIWKYLYDLQYQVRNASNMLYSLYYLRDTQLPESYIHPATQGYRECRIKYPDMPTTTVASLSNTIFALYQKEKKDIFSGKRGVRSYKNGLSIPISKKQIKFQIDNDGKYEIEWNAVSHGKVCFGFVFGRDRGNYSENIRKIIDCGLEYTDLSFQIKDGDLYILIPVKDIITDNNLDTNITIGVDLGIAIPAVCAISNSDDRAYIGCKEDFLRIRTHIQGIRRRFQRNLKFSNGGHGRNKKLTPLERMESKEKNFVQQYNHMISRRIVDFALKNKAGVIKLELLEGFGMDGKNEFILRNWSYFQLETQIAYKAKQYGIEIIHIDPYHTSQTCSACGNYEEGQREKQSEFICKKCGTKMNADYNAAKNIALSNKIVTKRDECEYWKHNSDIAFGRPISRPQGEGPRRLRRRKPLAKLENARTDIKDHEKQVI